MNLIENLYITYDDFYKIFIQVNNSEINLFRILVIEY